MLRKNVIIITKCSSLEHMFNISRTIIRVNMLIAVFKGEDVMLFGEKIKQLRLSKQMTQAQVAKEIGITERTYQYYETEGRYPKRNTTYMKLANLFGVDVSYLLSEEDNYVIDAGKKGGAKAQKDVQSLIAEVGGLFAGGELSEEDKDKVMKSINDLYWKAKEKNKKYTPDKYKK